MANLHSVFRFPFLFITYILFNYYILGIDNLGNSHTRVLPMLGVLLSALHALRREGRLSEVHRPEPDCRRRPLLDRLLQQHDQSVLIQFYEPRLQKSIQ